MSTEFNHFLIELSHFYNFILGADPGPYFPQDIRYWFRFQQFKDDLDEALDVLAQVWCDELKERGINVNSLADAPAEIQRIAQIAERQAERMARQAPESPQMPASNRAA